MKKIFTIIALVVAIGAYSQPCQNAMIYSSGVQYCRTYIYDLEKDTVSLGESIYVGFQFQRPGAFPSIDSTKFHIQNMTTLEYIPIWNNKWSLFCNLPTYATATEILCKMYLYIPLNSPTGDCRVTSIGGYGVDLNLGNIYVKPAIATNVNELSATDEIISVKYYNITGQEIQKPSHEYKGLVIEVSVTKELRTLVRKLVNVN